MVSAGFELRVCCRFRHRGEGRGTFGNHNAHKASKLQEGYYLEQIPQSLGTLSGTKPCMPRAHTIVAVQDCIR